MTDMMEDRVVIVGANGQFGRIWAHKLAALGADIAGMDLQPGLADPLVCKTYLASSIDDLTEPAAELIAGADYVLLCVPEDAILKSLPRLCALMKPDSLLMDIASVKTRIHQALETLDPTFGYLSLHPMFGPTDDFTDRAVCLIPVRENAGARRIEAIIAGWGARISTLTAEQHDTAAAFVQALPHIALIAFGAALDSSGVNFDLIWNIATPIQKTMLALVSRVVSGEHDTYWSIQSANPFSEAARDKLGTELGLASAIVQNGDEQGFSKKLESISRYLGDSADRLEKVSDTVVSITK